MHKTLKLVGIVLGIILLVVVLGAVFLTTLVNPNRLKPMLTEQVKKYTGRELTVSGDLSWSFFPYLGVKVGHMVLGNPAGFTEKTFVEFSDATVGVRLIPLVEGRVESSGVVLNGMHLHLIKKADGTVNWNFSQATATSGAQTAKQPTSSASAAKNTLAGLTIAGVDISNASVTYQDEQLKKSYDIKNFELHTGHISVTEPFPVKASFDFTANNPAASGHAALTGDVAFNLAAQVYTFRNLDFSANVQQDNKKINLNITGDMMADLNQQTLVWTNFKSNLNNVTMTGRMEVSHLTSNPVATGHVDLQPFDLKETFKSIGVNVDNLQTAKTVKGDADFTASASGVTSKSNLHIETLQADNITVTQINVKANLQNGVLNLAPINADFYQGTLQGDASVDLNASAPKITLHAKLQNVQAEPLMQDLAGADQKIKIAGLGNIELQVTTAGSDGNSIVRNLNGTSQFSFNNGAIVGLDLGYMVDTAAAVVKQQASNATNNNKTNFGTLTGTATIKNGVISNNDLVSDAPRFTTHGSGTIDLVNQKIDYTLNVSVKQRAGEAVNLGGVTLPVLISGNLKDPKIHLDSGSLVRSVAKQKIQEEIKKRLPGGNAGEVLKGLLGR